MQRHPAPHSIALTGPFAPEQIGAPCTPNTGDPATAARKVPI